MLEFFSNIRFIIVNLNWHIVCNISFSNLSIFTVAVSSFKFECLVFLICHIRFYVFYHHLMHVAMVTMCTYNEPVCSAWRSVHITWQSHRGMLTWHPVTWQWHWDQQYSLSPDSLTTDHNQIFYNWKKSKLLCWWDCIYFQACLVSIIWDAVNKLICGQKYISSNWLGLHCHSFMLNLGYWW